MNNPTKFAVQPLWSNRAFDGAGQGCVRSAATNPHAMPAVGLMPPTEGVCMTAGICPPGVAAGQPRPVNMGYFGGNVATGPKVYLIPWGWGGPGAVDPTPAPHSANDPGGV